MLKKKIQNIICHTKTMAYNIVGGQFKERQKKYIFDETKNYYHMWTANNVKSKIESFEINNYVFENFKTLLETSEKWKNYCRIITEGDDFIEFKLFNKYYIFRFTEMFNNNAVKNQYLIEEITYKFVRETLKMERTETFIEKCRFIIFGSGDMYIEKSETNKPNLTNQIINFESEFNILLPEIIR